MSALIPLIAATDYEGLKAALAQNPALANEGIGLPGNTNAREHPLHRLCDGVFHRLYSDEAAAAMGKILIEYGALVNGGVLKEKKDTPLIAAASLHADKTGMLYISAGADTRHAGTHGGTALHWAAWTGRDLLVKRLLQEKPDINQRCIDFRSTPLLWAVHGYKSDNGNNRHHQVECVRLLINAGADMTIPNADGKMPIELLNEEDTAMMELLKA